MEKKSSAWIYLAITILLWASFPVAAKLLLTGMNSIQILFWAFPTTAIFLFLISIFQGKWDLIKSYKAKDYLNFLYLGFIGIFLAAVCLVSAYMFSSAQEVSIINYFWPIATIIFSIIILKEKLTLKISLGVILAFIGVIIIASQGLKSFNFGIGWILAFLNSLTWGLFSVLGKKHNYESFTGMAFFYIAGFIFILPCILFTNFIVPNPIQWLGIIWVGIFTGGIGYVFWFLALKKGDTAKLSTAAYLVPFISLIYIALILKEKILITSIIGLVLIVAGILVQNKK
jgi:drug/metabolite transporter (DMT)-like permease